MAIELNFNLNMLMIVAFVLILGVVLVLMTTNKNQENFASAEATDGNYLIPYGYLKDSIHNGNPVSYDGLSVTQLQALKHVGPPRKDTTSADSITSGIVYQGHGIPLPGEQYVTKLPKGQKSLADFANKECRPDCCYGLMPSDRSCDRGCVCDN
jgi:hypothetical protein